MKVSAKLSYLRIAPRKTRLLVDLVRGKGVREAQTILNFAIKKGALPVLKLLNQAVASAINTFQLDPNNLYIAKIMVNEGPKLKRWRPRARGQAFQIQKKMSHIIIILDEKVESKGKKTVVTGKVAVPAMEKKTKTEGQAKAKIEKPKTIQETFKPKAEKSSQRIFRRKAF